MTLLTVFLLVAFGLVAVRLYLRRVGAAGKYTHGQWATIVTPTALVSLKNEAAFDRIVLQEEPGLGVYAFAFNQAAPSSPDRDYLLDTWEEAKAFCAERWGVPLDSWAPTDEHLNLA